MPNKKQNKGVKRFFILFAIALFLGAIFWFSYVLFNIVKEISLWGLRTFGLGFSLFLLFIVPLIVVGKRNPSLLWRWWYRWIGIVAIILMGFGILSFFKGGGILGEVSLGGKLGQWVVGPSKAIGILRLAVLGYAGVLLISPSLVLRLTTLSFKGLWLLSNYLFRLIEKLVKNLMHLFKRLPPKEEITPAPPSERQELREMAKELWEMEKNAARKELQQLAEELWRKYGKAKPSVITPTGWELPPLDLLAEVKEGEWRQMDAAEKAKLLEDALASYGVEAKVVQVNVGPTVTQFGVEPGWDKKYKEVKERDKDGNIRIKRVEVSRTRVKVERIQSLANDLALVLSVPSIRIEAPVPGKPLVGIEVPNTAMAIVTLRSVIETPAFQKLRAKSKLALALGKGSGGEPVVADLAKMPHILIAGATGSGKSVCLNSFICCLILYNTPDELRLMLIDPKRVELVAYNPLPHLITPVIIDMEKAVDALDSLIKEMNSRFRRFSEVGVRNIEEYNKSQHPPLPYIVLFIDELADLMMTASVEVEQRLCRLAQLSRATGIHLVVATQRPSVDVVTGLIKANFPTRISFAVSSQVDSRIILDRAGAEKLLGRGDMLFLPTEATKPKRLQGCYVSPEEIESLVSFWARQGKRISPIEIEAKKPEEDPLLEAARRLAQEHKKISASFLQRRLQIGYQRAVKLMEALEQEGVIKEGG